jgi:hypothetical protein
VNIDALLGQMNVAITADGYCGSQIPAYQS